MGIDIFAAKFGNALTALTGCYLFWHSSVWLREHGWKWKHAAFVIGLLLITARVFLDAFYWVLARGLAHPGERHHVFMGEWSWVQSLVTALLFMFGVVLCCKHIEELSVQHIVVLCWGFAVLSGVIAVL